MDNANVSLAVIRSINPSRAGAAICSSVAGLPTSNPSQLKSILPCRKALYNSCFSFVNEEAETRKLGEPIPLVWSRSCHHGNRTFRNDVQIDYSVKGKCRQSCLSVQLNELICTNRLTETILLNASHQCASSQKTALQYKCITGSGDLKSSDDKKKLSRALNVKPQLHICCEDLRWARLICVDPSLLQTGRCNV